MWRRRLKMRGYHCLLGLEQRSRTQNPCTGSMEGHRPCLYHALPRVETRSPGRGLGVGVVGARVPAAVPAVVALLAAPIEVVVGAVAAATVVGGVVARCGGAGGAVVGSVASAVPAGVGGSVGAVTVCDGESLSSLGVGVMLEAEFLEDEEGAGALEGVRRVLGSDHRLDVTVPRVEAAEKVQHLAWFGDRMADVAELTGEAFQLGVVVVDRHIALLQGTQLGL